MCAKAPILEKKWAVEAGGYRISEQVHIDSELLTIGCQDGKRCERHQREALPFSLLGNGYAEALQQVGCDCGGEHSA